MSRINRGQPRLDTQGATQTANLDSAPLNLNAPTASLVRTGAQPLISPPQPNDAGLPNPNPQPVDATLQPGQSLVNVLRDPNTSPRSRVYQTPQGVSVDAPTPMGHGFWNRLKKIGEGAVIGMGQQAQRNDASGRGQDLGSLLGAGAAGGVNGGVNPLSIDVFRRQQQIGQAENDQFRQGELARQTAETAHLNKLDLPDVPKPLLHPRENPDGSISVMQSDDNGKTWKENPSLTSRPPARQQTTKPPLFRPVKNPDGSTSTMRSDDNGATWKKDPSLESAAPPGKPTKPEGLTPYQQKERQANAAKLTGRIDKMRRDATAAINAATAEPDATKKAEWIQKYRNALTDGTAAATELQQGYGDLYEAGMGTSDVKGVNTQGEPWPYYKPVPQAVQPSPTGGIRGGGKKYVAPRVSASRLGELMK
jgi:hypothetical protein